MQAIREIRAVDSDNLVIKMPVYDTIEKSDRFPGFLDDSIKIDNFLVPSREERNASN